MLVDGLREPGDVQISPDGRRLLFTVTAADRTADVNRTAVWVCSRDGSGLRRLREAAEDQRSPRWAPDGTTVAIVRSHGDGHELVVLGSDASSTPRTVAREEEGISGLAWSPDGARLAYSTLVDPDDPELGRRGPVRVVRRLDYRWDGRGYLGEAREQLVVVDLAGGRRSQLTHDVLDHRNPQWSPSGRFIAVEAGDLLTETSRLVLVPTQGGPARRLGPAGQVDACAWSPDGTRLLVIGDDRRRFHPDVWTVDVPSGDTRRVTDGLVTLVTERPVWLDRRRALVRGVLQRDSVLLVIDVDSGEVEQLGYWEATHDGLSVDRMRSTAAQVRSTFQARPEVSLIDVTTATETTITTLNDRSGAPRPAPAHRRLKARRAGVPIESWMLTPPGFDAARRHPLIVDVMGGPYWFWSSGFDPVVAALLGNGFVVLLPHPRGSGSSGREFAHLADARGGPYGGEPFLDVMAALDDAARLPGVDPERVGIYGSSYGGYMVAWAITQTDRFRAAVCRAPITDFTAHITVSDCGVAMARDELPGLPDERQEWYDRHSPIRHARKASTPTLFSCGEEDGRTPIANAEAMFLRLKLAGCDTELVRYPGASHMMPWEGSPRQREDWLRRTVAWFTTHLRSDAGRSR